ncbi:hypothetical protein HCN44_001018 [Aphidius gifuensis]|uniref:hydroxyisourate hydrolase n=1 Tax=Aphidius gifuensis TaxID=684658 RepID=A0A835CPU3_APHGI|nr:mediator of RNA polymerase II transcription subunit 13-like [Aphidius gifuensis]KAF7988445.1 hypothetical protein HCN44_001018 [Aphidius gifuensis]
MIKMETEIQDIIIDGSTMIAGEIYTPQKLTPTGKISHAKTRVYTQRYRKEWEESPEFKGWLTSVENEPTRALCKYCDKNLHAHRLSLLKHTCTLKHTRATLLHAENLKKRKLKAKARTIKTENPMMLIEEVDLGTLKRSMSGDEEEEEVAETDELVFDEERLDDEDDGDMDVDGGIDILDDDDEDDGTQNNDDSQNIDDMQLEIHDENDENSDSCVLRVESEDDDNNNDDNNDKIMIDKSKIKTEIIHTDTLAQAMADVHGITDNDEEISDNIHAVIDHDIDDNTTLLNDENTTILSDHNVTNETTVSTSSPVKSSDDNNSITNKTNQDNKKSTNNDKKIDTKVIKKILTKTKGGMQFQRFSFNGKTYNFPSGQLAPNTQLLLANAINKNNITSITLPASSKTGCLRPIAPKVNKPIFVTTPVSSSSSKILTKQINTIKRNNDIGNTIEFLTTHVVDTSKGIPANSMRICLYKLTDGRWSFVNESITTASGNCIDIGKTIKPSAGRYKLQFDTEKYFSAKRVETLYPFVEIVVDVKNPNSNYHLELSVSPFGYSTCRGNSR